MATVNNLVINLMVKHSQLQQGLNQAGSSVKRFQADAAKSARGVQTAFLQAGFGLQDFIAVMSQPGMGLAAAVRSSVNNLQVMSSTLGGPVLGSIIGVGIGLAAALIPSLIRSTKATKDFSDEVSKEIATFAHLNASGQSVLDFYDGLQKSIDNLKIDRLQKLQESIRETVKNVKVNRTYWDDIKSFWGQQVPQALGLTGPPDDAGVGAINNDIATKQKLSNLADARRQNEFRQIFNAPEERDFSRLGELISSVIPGLEGNRRDALRSIAESNNLKEAMDHIAPATQFGTTEAAQVGLGAGQQALRMFQEEQKQRELLEKIEAELRKAREEVDKIVSF